MTMQTILLTVPVAGPLLAVGGSLLLGAHPRLQRALSIGVLSGLLVDAVALLVLSDTDGRQVMHVGGHHPPLGVTLVADRFASLTLVIAVAVAFAVLLYAVGQGSTETRIRNIPSIFHPTYLAMVAGIAMVFLTGDLFTMFVGFEVMLTASYVLITLGATRERVRAGMTYVVSSVTASMFLLTTIGFTYAVTGTVNLAQLSAATRELPTGMQQLLEVMLLLTLGIKAAMVPLHWWLPDSYPTAPAPVTAIFAALLTKVAVYAIIRTQTLLFPRDDPWTLLLVLAASTMLLGTLGALVQDNLNRVLSFTLVAHIGFMLFGLAVSTAAGLAAALLYLAHHITVQVALFLVVGLVERRQGTVSLSKLRGLATVPPMLAASFLVPALSLGGIPPLAGFVGKFSLLRAAAAQAAPLVVAVAVVTVLASLLTLAALARVWVSAFWGCPTREVRERRPDDLVDVGVRSPNRLMYGAAGLAVVLGLGVAASVGPLSSYSQRAAAELTDREAYHGSVLSARGAR